MTIAGLAVVGVLLATGAAIGGPIFSGSSPAGTPAEDGAETANGTAVHPTDGALVLETRANATVTGTTDRAPGTSLTVRLVSDGQSAFLVQRTTTVREDGTFAATVDLSSVATNTTAKVTVLADDTELTNRTARIESVPGTDTGEAGTTGEADTRFRHDGENVTVQSAADQRIAGTTDLEPGTNVTVRLKSGNSGTPFLRQRTATVGEDGTFAVEMDFGNVEAGTTFEASVHHDGETLVETDGVVR